MIKAIIFDCFGVLTTDLWKEFVESQPIEVDRAKLRQLNSQLDAGFLSLTDFTRGVKELTGTYPDRIEDILSTSQATKNVKLLGIIRNLKESGFKVGMLSNVSSNWIREVFLSEEEQALFDDMVFSYEVHLTKPDQRIFRLSCERLGIEPAESILVDDSKANCEAAEDLDIKTIHYQNFSRFTEELSKLTGGKI